MHNSRGARRRFSQFGSATHKGRIGDITVWVHIEKDGWESGYSIRSDKGMPDEIREAVETWVKTGSYADMGLTEYLRRLFNRMDYL